MPGKIKTTSETVATKLKQLRSKKTISQKKPWLSIIIPTLNEEKIIGETIAKIKAIAPRGVELIVADGRSRDHTVEIALKHGARVVFEGRGFPSIGSGRNAGAKVARADLFLFNDADTIPDPRFFNAIRKDFQDERVVGVGCKVMPDERGFLTRVFFNFLNFLVHLSVWLGRPAIAGNCVAYRKKQFFKVNGFDEEMQASEDQDLCIRISKLGKVVYHPELVAITSSRRLKKFGLVGLVIDWSRTTVNFLIGRKTKRYAIIREV